MGRVTAYITIGIPGSGKSTYLNDHVTGNGVMLIHPDGIRAEVTGSEADGSQDSEVWHRAYQRTADALRAGQSVVFDSTMTVPDRRKTMTQFCRNNGAERVIALWFTTPVGLCLVRNAARERVVPQNVIEDMAMRLREWPPSLAEGFDEIHQIDASVR